MASAKTKIIILLLGLALVWQPGFMAQAATYGPQYFFAIDGEVSGQALPGAEKVYVNNKSVELNPDKSFTAQIHLKSGEKYLTITTKYKGLSYVKKYLVVRHPGVNKPFKITVSPTDFKKLIVKKPAVKKSYKKLVVKKLAPKPIKKIQLKSAEKWLGFEYVVELELGRLLVIRKVEQKYFGIIYDKLNYLWLPMQEITHQEFKDLLEKGIIPKAFRV